MATLYYVIDLSILGTPSAAQIKAGQDAAGGPATAAGNAVAPTTSGQFTFPTPAAGLTPDTEYQVAFVWSDGVTDSNVVESAPFMSASASDVVGGMATGEFSDNAAFSGARTFAGALDTTEQVDTAAFAGDVIASFSEGDLDVAEDLDAFAAVGTVGDPSGKSGDLATIEQHDTAAFAGARTYFGAMAATETHDNAAFAGVNVPQQVSGAFDVEEVRDLATITGTATTGVPVSGGLATTEARDSAAFSGARTYVGALAAAEARDNAAFAGFVTKFITGAMAALEQRDAALFASNAIVGNNFIILRDANVGLNVSPQQQWRDGAPRNPDGRLLPTKLGSVEVPNNLTNRRDLTRREVRLVQAPQDTQALVDVVPGYYSFVPVKAGDWVWCLNRDNAVDDADNPIGLDDVVV
jgi:hypothetical protein